MFSATTTIVTASNTGKTNIERQYLPPSPPRSDKSDDEVEGLGSIPLPPPSVNPTKVLSIDIGTPDAHVPRDPRLIRLTGAHPLNVEAPLSLLFDSGFLTPPELFFVRNHGAVPEVLDEDVLDWDITIEGLVETPITLTLSQILSDFEQITAPITLVCAGNRRKEQNQIRKSQGFSWGAGGVSTSLFTGPLLADILRAAKPLRNARYLCMEGADELPNGNYGTSVRLSQVMDQNRGIMLAHKMNGELLRPDHGHPLRVVVPSMIGGRSVKWLKRLILTEGPSKNWYHTYDNRVLPTMVTAEMTKLDKNWWYDERYAIYDLSVNSAIAYPAHDEKLVIGLDPNKQRYSIRGYAYAGAGRRITRVEVSLDKGRSWSLAQVSCPEDLYRNVPEDSMLFGGRVDMTYRDSCLCWIFWSLDVQVSSLSNAEDIVVRAMDDSLNTQSRDPYWSVLGMMHNSWFRIAIRKEAGGQILRFEHPTQPALQKGGWMERVNNEGGDLLDSNWGEKTDKSESAGPAVKQRKKDIVVLKNDSVTRIIDIDELRKHDKSDEPWFVVDGEVYDGTGFLKEHPGGVTSITAAAGLDATDEFMGIHSDSAKAMMPKYHIGSLSEPSRLALAEQGPPSTDTSNPSEIFLNPRLWSKARMVEKTVVSWDTRIFSFSLETPEQGLGLPVGQHLLLKIKDLVTEMPITRPYTPISSPTDKGVVHVLVKLYFDSPTAGGGGEMTLALDKLPIGHIVEFKGPIGKLIYHGQGNLTILDVPRQVETFLMICAGSGITPIFQVLRAVVANPTDTTKCTVLYGNRLEEDILCKEELDGFGDSHADRCEIVYSLTKPEANWDGEVGRISAGLINRYSTLDRLGKKSMVLICGPEGFEKAVHGILAATGWDDRDIVFF